MPQSPRAYLARKTPKPRYISGLPNWVPVANMRQRTPNNVARPPKPDFDIPLQ